MKNINWLDVQKYYDDNHFWNDILKKFNICSHTLNKAVKSGKIITRTRSESSKIYSKLHPQKHTEETKKKISKIRREYLEEHPDKVPYLLNHSSRGESYPEKYFREILDKNEMIYETKFPYSIYELDFAFVYKSINLEIDGSQHIEDMKIFESNKIRDEYMKNRGWTTIRIDWRRYQKLKTIEKEKFIDDLIKYIKNQDCKLPIIENKDKKSICDCGNVKYFRSKQCIDCQHKNQRKVKDRPSLEELLRNIEDIGYEGTARKYGVSSNNIRKWIKKYTKFETK